MVQVTRKDLLCQDHSQGEEVAESKEEKKRKTDEDLDGKEAKACDGTSTNMGEVGKFSEVVDGSRGTSTELGELLSTESGQQNERLAGSFAAGDSTAPVLEFDMFVWFQKDLQ